MTKKEKPKPRNFWLEGPTLLTSLPDIKRGLTHILKNHPELKASHAEKGMIDWRKQPEGFEGLINIILAQQISTAAAATIIGRMQAKLKEVTPRRLLKLDDEDMRTIGLSRSKAAYARHLAEQIVKRKFNPDDIKDMNDEEAFESLLALKGIGQWSAEIYLMFSLGRGDIWPAGDIALQKGIQRLHNLKERPLPDKTRLLSEKWAPYRSAASLIVWRA